MNKEYNNLTIDNLMRTDWINQFDEYQIRKIIQGIRNQLDISWYAKKEFNWLQMEQIRLGLLYDLDVSVYAKKEFSSDKMFKIREKLLREREKLENE